MLTLKYISYIDISHRYTRYQPVSESNFTLGAQQ